MTGSLALVNATIVDARGTRRADLRIQDGLISAVGDRVDADTVA